MRKCFYRSSAIPRLRRGAKSAPGPRRVHSAAPQGRCALLHAEGQSVRRRTMVAPLPSLLSRSCATAAHQTTVTTTTTTTTSSSPNATSPLGGDGGVDGNGVGLLVDASNVSFGGPKDVPERPPLPVCDRFMHEWLNPAEPLSDADFHAKVAEYTKLSATRVTIQQLMAFASNANNETLMHSAQWLQHELRIRLSKRWLTLQHFPFLPDYEPFQAMLELYRTTLFELMSCPYPDTIETTWMFTLGLERVYQRHEDDVRRLAEGLYAWKMATFGNVAIPDSDDQELLGSLAQITSALDVLYTKRIGSRLLIGQHMAISQGVGGGLVEHCNMRALAEEAAQSAQDLCRYTYGESPEVKIVVPGDVRFPYIGRHIHHILFELLKNSLRATVEQFPQSYTGAHPDVTVVIAGGSDEVTMKVSDQGGGFRRHDLPKIWTYLYTTAPTLALSTDAAVHAALAGFGYGLPLSRLYARYFGGDLSLTSLDGWGTDAFCFLNRVGDTTERMV